MEKEPAKKGTEVARIPEGEQLPTIAEAMALGAVFVESGMFPGIQTKAQATAKIMMGREFGIGPVTSLQLIDVVLGRLRPRSQLIAALVKRSARYDYKIKQMDERVCIIEFSDNGQAVLESQWTIEDAERARLVKPDSGWLKYPKDMLFARALSSGATKICPELIGGYEPLEVEGGYDVVEGQIVKEGEPPHSEWQAFWGRAKELGFSEEATHKLLGVESLKEWLDQGYSLDAAEKILLLDKAERDKTLWGDVAPTPQPHQAHQEAAQRPAEEKPVASMGELRKDVVKALNATKTIEESKAWLLEVFGKDSTKELTEYQLRHALELLGEGE